MKKFTSLFFCFVSIFTFSQEEEVYSIYFEFDKFNLKDAQVESVVAFLTKIDTARIETIEIFGYCDDRGKDEYNHVLSTRRANTVKDKLVERGIKSKIIITLEGKGRIMLDEDLQENISEIRSKNRRVDVVLNLKPLPKEDLKIPGVYPTFTKDNIVGDRIVLSDMLFERGSSVLTVKCKNELDKMAKLLNKYKNLHIEIQGHVCCTPPNHKEAIDKATKKRKLSQNRAESVYKYLISKKIAKDRLTFKGYGNTVSLGKSPELDRRVELVITKL